ncbi:MAG: hypothetical protein MMC23_007396 [Stictis urceolatum]|nr:hypothetical protein [Stictis urceolata]
MQLTYLLALTGFAGVSLAIQPYQFQIYQTGGCTDSIPLNISGTTQGCSPAPEFGFFGVKVLALGPKCTINFVNDNACTDVLAKSPSAAIPVDGQCHPLPQGTLTYAVNCTA